MRGLIAVWVGLGFALTVQAQPPRPTGSGAIGSPLVSYRTVPLLLPDGGWTTATIRTSSWTYRDHNGALQVYAESEATTPLPHGTWRLRLYRDETVTPGILLDGSRTTRNQRGESEHFTPSYLPLLERYYRP